MANTQTFAGIIHEMARDAYNAQQPADIRMGDIIQTDPIRIKLDVGPTISENDFLIVTSTAREKAATGARALLFKSAGTNARYYFFDITG